MPPFDSPRILTNRDSQNRWAGVGNQLRPYTPPFLSPLEWGGRNLILFQLLQKAVSKVVVGFSIDDVALIGIDDEIIAFILTDFV